MESIRECINRLFVKTNVKIFQESERDILNVKLEENIPNRRLLKRLKANKDDSKDKDLLKQIDQMMSNNVWKKTVMVMCNDGKNSNKLERWLIKVTFWHSF